jgi:eukaryotic-like serine/threonine-protein kinase
VAADENPPTHRLRSTEAGLGFEQAPTNGDVPDSLRRWERYAVLSLLGEGGMGRVYRGFDPRLQRPIALKVLGRAHGAERRFLREARLQARIVHENVCKVYEVGELDGEPYIAMQLIAGKTLQAILPELDAAQKLAILEDVALAVHAAHRLGLIHRDLKPSNIMVERSEDGTLKPYVMDFGLARDLSTESVTVTGEVLGTPAFMSPEQAAGRPADARSDVYGLGATLYQVLTGRPPFEGSAAEVLARVTSVDPPSLRSLAGGVSIDAATITHHCLEKDPSRRYPSALALAEDLRGAIRRRWRSPRTCAACGRASRSRRGGPASRTASRGRRASNASR